MQNINAVLRAFEKLFDSDALGQSRCDTLTAMADDDYSHEQRRFHQWLPLVEHGQTIEFYPPVGGVRSNAFKYDAHNSTYVRLSNDTDSLTVAVPFVMIEFIAPTDRGSVLRLRREMQFHSGTLV